MSDIIHKKQGIMKVIVYGLGIIGASVAASLKAAGHEVLGKNRSRESIVYALEHGMIDGEADSLCGVDVVFLALPPRVTMRVLDEGAFSDGCIVADICGVKAPVEEVVLKKPRAWRYVGTHPMAGKETSGIRSASAALFRGANFVMVKNASTDSDAFSVVRALAQDMGFGRIVECSAAEHDKMIALTSQLAHVVANSYVTTPLSARCKGFTGGSFQDMSRVAPVDEGVWAELFSLNSTCLCDEIGRLIARLGQFRDAVSARDEEAICRLMREGKERYLEFFREK